MPRLENSLDIKLTYYGDCFIKEGEKGTADEGRVFLGSPTTYAYFPISHSAFLAGIDYWGKGKAPYCRFKEGSKEAKDLLVKFLQSGRKEFHRKRRADIERAKVDPCFPKHTGKVTDTTNGIGGTYHTMYCDKCKSTWHIDSGD